MLFRPASLPVCFALCLAPLCAHVQAAPAAPAIPPPALIDPGARALFTQMVAAQKSLGSFKITVDADDRSGETVLPGTRSRTTVLFSAPARAAVTQTLDGKPLGELLSDGSALTRVDTRHKEYRRDRLPAAGAAAIVITQVGNLGVLPRSYADPGGLSALLTVSGLIAVARGQAEDPIGGVPVESVVARIIGSDAAEGTFTFVIGQSDHLLRRVIISGTPAAAKPAAPRTLTHTETITALQVNPPVPASAFAYKPGAGFKNITAPR